VTSSGKMHKIRYVGNFEIDNARGKNLRYGMV